MLLFNRQKCIEQRIVMLAPDSATKNIFKALYAARQQSAHDISSTLELQTRLGRIAMRQAKTPEASEEDIQRIGEQIAHFALGDITLWRLVQQIQRILTDYNCYPKVAFFVDEVGKHSRIHKNPTAQQAIGTAWRNLLNDTPYVCAKVKTHFYPTEIDIQIPHYLSSDGTTDAKATEEHLKKTYPYLTDYRLTMAKGRPMSEEMIDSIPLPILERLLFRARTRIWSPINHRQ